MANAKTPANLTITPRDLRFGRGERRRRWWLNNDPVATAVYNALSVTFPKGEAFFIESVRRFREGVSPRLVEEIAAFTRQEAIHTREHVAFNRHVEAQGYDVSRLEARVDEELAVALGRPAIVSLAATMCLEHFTAILAHAIVADPKHLAGGDASAADLWRWHAIEEIEHKGVAYDVWLHATRDWSRLRRWWIKAHAMMIVTAHFVSGRTRGMLDLLAQDGLTGAGVKWRLFRYAFGRPGLARALVWPWIAFFLPGFHPWNHDDRALIGKVDSEFAAARLGTA
jgi:predicted metal-dependent hydrolase